MSGIAETMTIDLSHRRFGEGIPLDDFAWLRARSPVYWYADGPFWVVTGHALIGAMNRDVQTFSSARGVHLSSAEELDESSAPHWVRRMLVEMDPPEHTRYRAILSRSFTPAAIGRMRESVSRIADEIVGEYLRAGGGDWAIDVAAAVPFRVMADLVGVPASDCTTVMRLTRVLAASADPEYRPDDGVLDRARAEFDEYCAGVVTEHRRRPAEDLTSALIDYDDGARLSDEELANYVGVLLQGGAETTRHLISHALVLLLQEPAQARRLAVGEVTMDAAVTELVRYVSPVMQHGRTATRDVQIGGQHIAAGDHVTLWMISGNRDDAVFDDPDTLDLGRSPNRVISFGSGGPHYCLGAGLTQLETKVVLEHLLPHLHRIELAGPIERMHSNFFNGIRHLPATVVR